MQKVLSHQVVNQIVTLSDAMSGEKINKLEFDTCSDKWEDTFSPTLGRGRKGYWGWCGGRMDTVGALRTAVDTRWLFGRHVPPLPLSALPPVGVDGVTDKP